MYDVTLPASLVTPYGEYFSWSTERFDTRSEALAYAKQTLHLSLLEYVIVSYQEETIEVIKQGYRGSSLCT